MEEFTDPAGMTDPNELIAHIFTRLSFYQSDFEAKNMDAQIWGNLNCYFEQGSITNSDFRGLRFSKAYGEDFDDNYKKLANIEGVTKLLDKDWAGASLPGRGRHTPSTESEIDQ